MRWWYARGIICSCGEYFILSPIYVNRRSSFCDKFSCFHYLQGDVAGDVCGTRCAPEQGSEASAFDLGLQVLRVRNDVQLELSRTTCFLIAHARHRSVISFLGRAGNTLSRGRIHTLSAGLPLSYGPETAGRREDPDGRSDSWPLPGSFIRDITKCQTSNLGVMMLHDCCRRCANRNATSVQGRSTIASSHTNFTHVHDLKPAHSGVACEYFRKVWDSIPPFCRRRRTFSCSEKLIQSPSCCMKSAWLDTQFTVHEGRSFWDRSLTSY